MDRDKFIQDFVKRGKESGATKEQVTEKLTTALQEFDSKFGKEKEDTRSSLQKVTDFMGLGNVSKNITMGLQAPLAGAGIEKQDIKSQDLFKQSQELIRQAKQETDPTRKAQLLQQSRDVDQQIEASGQRAGELGDIVQRGGQITEREMGMSPEEFALRRGGAMTAELASYAVPGVLGPAATAGGRIATAAGRGAITGGFQGASRAATDADTLAQAGLDIGMGATTGAVTGAAFQGLLEGGKGLVKAFSKATASQRQKLIDVYKSTLKSNVKDQKFYQQYGGEDMVAKDAIKYKIAPTKEGVKKQLTEYGPEFNRKVQTEIAKNPDKKIDISKVYETAKKRILTSLRGPENSEMRSGAEKYFKEADNIYLKSGEQGAGSANRLRIRLDKITGGLLDNEITQGRKKAIKAFTSELRGAFREELPQLRDSFKKYQLLSGLSEAMQKEPKTGIVELAGAGVLPGTGGMNILEFLASKAVRSPGLRRAVAGQGIRMGSKPVTQAAQQIPQQLLTPATAASSSQIPPELRKLLGL